MSTTTSKFTVEIMRLCPQYIEIEVEANSEDEAEAKALEKSCNLSFLGAKNGEADYEVMSVTGQCAEK